MMARPRKTQYQDLPRNLAFDTSNRGYRYRHPVTKRVTPMGKNKALAIHAAKQLNAMLQPDVDLVAKVLGHGTTLKHFIEETYRPLLEKEAHAPRTRQAYESQLAVIQKSPLGSCKVAECSVQDIAAFLDTLANTPRTANKYRGLLNQLFKVAIAKGIRSDNPAAQTLKARVVKQRQRLTLEAFEVIHAEAPAWLQRAMELGLLTLQRVHEIAHMQFSHLKTEDIPNRGLVEFLYVIQKKTQKVGRSAHLKIEVTPELKQLIQRCRDALASPYLIHRRPERMPSWETRRTLKTKSHVTQVTPEFISKQFSAVRDATGFFKDLPKPTRPTFHEIRSLGIVLRENQGQDAQALAGHTTRTMTEYYKKGHDQVQWTVVSLASLKLTLKS